MRRRPRKRCTSTCVKGARLVVPTAIVVPMPGRITKEQSLLKEKLVLMEDGRTGSYCNVVCGCVHLCHPCTNRHICKGRPPSPGERLHGSIND